jgi:hypothetical protein
LGFRRVLVDLAEPYGQGNLCGPVAGRCFRLSDTPRLDREGLELRLRREQEGFALSYGLHVLFEGGASLFTDAWDKTAKV